MLEQISLQHTFEKHLLQSRLETQEQSFRYFSEEVHDNVGQVLSVIGMHLYQLQSEYAGERATRLVQESSELLNKAISDLRTISHTLKGQYFSKAGLLEALRTEIEYINFVKSPLCRLEIIGDPVEMSPDRQTLLFRIIQETIGNALKHAKPTSILIVLEYNNDILTVSITDNGKGFDLDSQDETITGLGLANMQLRAKLLGGDLKIQSKEGKGTTLSLTIAINAT
jgi:signal transduction histidine kinase